MYNVLNTLSEYTYFYISKNITSYTFLLVFKIVESLQCILNLSSEHVIPDITEKCKNHPSIVAPKSTCSYLSFNFELLDRQCILN